MMLCPASREDLSALIAGLNDRGQKLSEVDLGRMGQLLDHKVEDMTARAEAGLTLAALQAQLAARGQWLPIDPPDPDRLSIGALLATDASGPRRFGCGTIRDHLIGLTVVLANGRLVRSGGNVVKNVAGYDLMKLFVGGRGSLGVIVEATFKLRPVPECERFVQFRCLSLADADRLAASILESDVSPNVLDLHNLPAAAGAFWLVLGFAGTTEEVAWEMNRAASLGPLQPTSLEYDQRFRGAGASLERVSVLPSKCLSVLEGLDGARFIARMGNGTVYHDQPHSTAARSGSPADANRAATLASLTRRLKDEFDPKHILADPPT